MMALWGRLNRAGNVRREPHAPEPAMMRARSHARTHVGRVRTVNEDRLLDRADRGLWAIADGMGGHSAGDAAAETVIAGLHALANDPAPLSARAIDRALVDAGRAIQTRSADLPRVSGSTVVALHLAGQEATVLWAGDSRAYRLRSGRLEQLTRDHSVVQELVDAGALAADSAESHPQAHVITRALGATGDVVIDQIRTDAVAGDVYLLCSDGLSRTAAADHFARLLRLSGDAAADALLRGALDAGGVDNISVIVIEVCDLS